LLKSESVDGGHCRAIAQAAGVGAPSSVVRSH
jgi:hypothetical protein